MELDFETFLNELNTEDDNTIYNENFEEFLDTIYRMDNHLLREQFNAIYGFTRDLDDDLDLNVDDDLLEMIEVFEDGSEQEADAPPFEAF